MARISEFLYGIQSGLKVELFGTVFLTGTSSVGCKPYRAGQT